MSGHENEVRSAGGQLDSHLAKQGSSSRDQVSRRPSEKQPEKIEASGDELKMTLPIHAQKDAYSAGTAPGPLPPRLLAIRGLCTRTPPPPSTLWTTVSDRLVCFGRPLRTPACGLAEVVTEERPTPLVSQRPLQRARCR